MKKNFFRSTALVAMMLCGINANAQYDLGALAGAISGNDSGQSLATALTSIFSGEKQASASNIEGTWPYSEPAILFDSEDYLTKAGGKVVAQKLEKKIQAVFNKYGVTKGAVKFVFNSDGTFVETIKTKTIKGKWSVENNTLKLTFGTIKPKTVEITTQLEGKQMMMVTDATKLLTLVQGMTSSSNSSNLKAISALLKNVKGMKVGVTLTKQ